MQVWAQYCSVLIFFACNNDQSRTRLVQYVRSGRTRLVQYFRSVYKQMMGGPFDQSEAAKRSIILDDWYQLNTTLVLKGNFTGGSLPASHLGLATRRPPQLKEFTVSDANFTAGGGKIGHCTFFSLQWSHYVEFSGQEWRKHVPASGLGLSAFQSARFATDTSHAASSHPVLLDFDALVLDTVLSVLITGWSVF